MKVYVLLNIQYKYMKEIFNINFHNKYSMQFLIKFLLLSVHINCVRCLMRNLMHFMQEKISKPIGQYYVIPVLKGRSTFLIVIKGVPPLSAVCSSVCCFEKCFKCGTRVQHATRMLHYSASRHFFMRA